MSKAWVYVRIVANLLNLLSWNCWHVDFTLVLKSNLAPCTSWSFLFGFRDLSLGCFHRTLWFNCRFNWWLNNYISFLEDVFWRFIASRNSLNIETLLILRFHLKFLLFLFNNLLLTLFDLTLSWRFLRLLLDWFWRLLFLLDSWRFLDRFWFALFGIQILGEDLLRRLFANCLLLLAHATSRWFLFDNVLGETLIFSFTLFTSRSSTVALLRLASLFLRFWFRRTLARFFILFWLLVRFLFIIDYLSIYWVLTSLLSDLEFFCDHVGIISWREAFTTDLTWWLILTFLLVIVSKIFGSVVFCKNSWSNVNKQIGFITSFALASSLYFWSLRLLTFLLFFQLLLLVIFWLFDCFFILFLFLDWLFLHFHLNIFFRICRFRCRLLNWFLNIVFFYYWLLRFNSLFYKTSKTHSIFF